MIFSSYGFLRLKNLPNLPEEDIKFLEMKRCLHVPRKSILDEFISSFFLHVHPILPVLSEPDFRLLYEDTGCGLDTGSNMSLLVLYSMLFASCQVRLNKEPGKKFHMLKRASFFLQMQYRERDISTEKPLDGSSTREQK